jgi:hypothetical protein
MMGCYSWYQSNIEDKCTLTNLKNDQQCFTVRNVFYAHKDYSSFLGGKLIVFKLCNYGIAPTKVSCVIFGIVLTYFIIYEAYFVVGEFL